MSKSRIGLDIGSTAVRAVEVTAGDDPAVVRAAQVPLPPGTVEGGEVRQPAVLGESLRQLWQRGGFKDKKVWIGVGNQRLVVREIALPSMPEKELRASLGLQVQELIPMPIDQAVLDYDPIEEFERDGRTMMRMLLVAAQREMVDQIVEGVTHARLEPVGLDLIPFAMVRSVGTTGIGMDLEEEGDEAVVDVGAHVTNIVVHAAGTTRFVRILPSGGRDVTLALARRFEIDEDVAEELKRGGAPEVVGHASPEPDAQDADVTDQADGPAPGTSAPSTWEPPRPEAIDDLIMERLTTFIDEIRSSLEFYTAQVQGTRITRVVFTGGGSKLDGFFEVARDRIPVEVLAGTAFGRARADVALSEAAMGEAEPVLAVAVGLALPGRET